MNDESVLKAYQLFFLCQHEATRYDALEIRSLDSESGCVRPQRETKRHKLMCATHSVQTMLAKLCDGYGCGGNWFNDQRINGWMARQCNVLGYWLSLLIFTC
jgi:hypothetical protein